MIAEMVIFGPGGKDCAVAAAAIASRLTDAAKRFMHEPPNEVSAYVTAHFLLNADSGHDLPAIGMKKLSAVVGRFA